MRRCVAKQQKSTSHLWQLICEEGHGLLRLVGVTRDDALRGANVLLQQPVHVGAAAAAAEPIGHNWKSACELLLVQQCYICSKLTGLICSTTEINYARDHWQEPYGSIARGQQLGRLGGTKLHNRCTDQHHHAHGQTSLSSKQHLNTHVV
jgi:hypothetical protein